jgi:hypothetical protein
MSAPRIERWLWRAGLAAILLHPAAYLGMFAGDAEIHLVYGRAAASGRFFEFNPGEASPGVTSPGYMVVLALLFRAIPEAQLPVAVKVLDLLFWYASLGLVYLMMGRLTSDLRARRLATIAAGLLPGSTYNATIGMENGLFGCVVLLAVLLAIRLRWFESKTVPITGELAIGVVLGCGCWLRPEGFVVAALFFLVRWWRAPSLLGSLGSLVPLLLLAVALLHFHHAHTGYWLPASARARILLGQQEAWHVGPLFVSWKPLRLLALYFPLSALWLIGCWWIARNRLPCEDRGALGFAAIASLLFFLLYSTVLGAPHLGRYLIFVMPLVVVIAVLAARQIWTTWSTRTSALKVSAVALASLWLGAVWTWEVVERRELGARSELAHAMRAPADRASVSDRLEALLGHPTKRPIVVALQEVQLRYWLDDRFVVRSLDGRTDPLLLQYSDGNRFDHPRYLRDRGVDFVLATPNYNRDPKAWSLARLQELQVGETARVEGLSLVRLAGDASLTPWIFRVQPDGGR